MSDDATGSAVGRPDDAPPEGAHLARRTLTNLAGIVTSNLARLGALAMISHVGGPATLGNVQSAVSGANLAALLGPSSIGGAAGRFLPTSQDPAEGVAKRILLQGTLLGLLLALLCAAVLLPLFGAKVAVGTAVLTAVLCSWVVCRGVVIGRGALLSSLMRIEVGASLGLVVAIAILVRWDVSWPVYVLALTVLHIPLIAWVWAQYRTVPRAETVVPGYRRYVGFAVLGTIASAGLVHLTNLVTNGLGGAEQAGYLAAGLLLLSPLGMAFAALTQVSLPWLSRLLVEGRAEEAERRGRQLTASVHFIVGTVLLVLVPLGPPLGRLGFGDDMRLDFAIMIALGCASLALGGRVGSVVLLSAQGHAGVQRMAGLSYVGLTVAVVVWAIAFGVRGEISAVTAGLGYGMGATVLTVLVTGVAQGSATATRLAFGIVCWLTAAGCTAYAVARPGALPLVLTVAALGLWLTSNRDGIKHLAGWAGSLRGRR